jgi:hypothetical protein
MDKDFMRRFIKHSRSLYESNQIEKFLSVVLQIQLDPVDKRKASEESIQRLIETKKKYTNGKESESSSVVWSNIHNELNCWQMEMNSYMEKNKTDKPISKSWCQQFLFFVGKIKDQVEKLGKGRVDGLLIYEYVARQRQFKMTSQYYIYLLLLIFDVPRQEPNIYIENRLSFETQMSREVTEFGSYVTSRTRWYLPRYSDDRRIFYQENIEFMVLLRDCAVLFFIQDSNNLNFIYLPWNNLRMIYTDLQKQRSVQNQETPWTHEDYFKFTQDKIYGEKKGETQERENIVQDIGDQKHPQTTLGLSKLLCRMKELSS